MLKNLKYYLRLLSYKMSLEGEDSDNTYQGQSVIHDGAGKTYFDINDLPDGYPEITNIKLSPRQKKLKERDLAELAQLRDNAKAERTKMQKEFNDRQTANNDKKAAVKAAKFAKSKARKQTTTSKKTKTNWSFFRKKVSPEPL